jgi:hypothetical protein
MKKMPAKYIIDLFDNLDGHRTSPQNAPHFVRKLFGNRSFRTALIDLFNNLARFRTALFIAPIAAALIFTACEQLDVVGAGSAASFEKMLQALPAAVSPDESGGPWALTAPDGSAKFIWPRAPGAASGREDVSIEFAAAPFVAAGLDVKRLPAGILRGDKLVFGVSLGLEDGAASGPDESPFASFQTVLRAKPERFGYHAALDHYGIDLDGGNMFEWAKDLETNDKDIVFVLNPEPFLSAGADPSKIGGWAFTKVPTMDAEGNKIEVDKILKPFDLK